MLFKFYSFILISIDKEIDDFNYIEEHDMSKFITAALTTASLALMNVSTAQAMTKLVDSNHPTFPTQKEENLEVFQSSQEVELAYTVEECYWEIYPNGDYQEICIYY